jgi:probable rRNA maturation factor
MAIHKIYARHSGVRIEDRLSIPLIKRCVSAALCFEGVDLPCEVSVLITGDRGIREINREYRGVDKPTDVLSFPMQAFSPPGWAAPSPDATCPETGLIPLGEIILSAERVGSQACEYGQTRERETAYLAIHSVLHLLGYDHVDEAEEKKKMRNCEDAIMIEMGLL